MPASDRRRTLRYLDGDITAEHAADLLGPFVSVSEVILEARARFGRVRDQRDAFTESEYRRALVMLGLDTAPHGSS